MKRIAILLLSCCLFATACKKTDNNGNEPVTYSVNGITDIVIGDVVSFEKWVLYDVKGKAGYKEHVTLSFEGLPDDVIVDTTVHHTMDGDLDFKAAVRLKKIGNDHQAHEYNIKLVCNGSVTGKRSYDLKLKVLERKLGAVNGANLAKEVLGDWSNCWENGYGTNYDDYISFVPGSDSIAYLGNFGNWRPSQAIQVCFHADGTISIPLIQGFNQNAIAYNQYDKFYSGITGTGAYNANYIAITVQFYGGGSPYTNYIIMQR